RALSALHDGVVMDRFEVPRELWKEALGSISPDVRAALARAARNIAAAQRAALPVAFEVETEPGVLVGRRPDPLDRVGVYAPGGRASYPSSVLMGVVPARVAGVGEIVVCSPPGLNGVPATSVLAAAEIAGADRLFAIGGAGAIAAMAYGTETVPAVQCIVGPGNGYVNEAKLQVARDVRIDGPAGPSELLVICDDALQLAAAARELVAQAEHAPDSCAVAVVVGEGLAQELNARLAREMASAGRRQIVEAALGRNGAILQARDAAEAACFATSYAPEHLLLAVHDPDWYFQRIRGAGAVFFGEASSVTFGDYLSGANHVLPTGGRARTMSGLSVLDFVRWTSYIHVSRAGAAALAGATGRFANAEGLPGHAAAATAWEASDR
ncbi:MAG: histidinol dehydrogenase, partial [Gemmatimonadaceae bacterium]